MFNKVDLGLERRETLTTNDDAEKRQRHTEFASFQAESVRPGTILEDCNSKSAHDYR